MRHRKRGRVLGRSPSHRKALFQNLTKALVLTEDPRVEPDEVGAPKVKGRIITTLPKAKEVRSLVEKVITIAKRALPAQDQAAKFATSAKRGTDEWTAWRKGQGWKQWQAAMAPAVAARRRIEALLRDVGDSRPGRKGDKRVIRILFDVLAPRFANRPGGYTRILKLAKPRLGDAGARACLGFVGTNDRVVQKSAAPSFEGSKPAEAAKT
jgi:large subunit ribosomal protein L17